MGTARATLTCEDSEWSRKFEEPWQEGWGRFFSKAASKGLPRTFNTVGWRCSNVCVRVRETREDMRILWQGIYVKI